MTAEHWRRLMTTWSNVGFSVLPAHGHFDTFGIDDMKDAQ